MTTIVETTATNAAPRQTTVKTEGDLIIYATPTVELTFSAQTGQWLGWRDQATNVAVKVGATGAPDLILLSDGEEHRPPPRRIPYYTDATETSGPGRFVGYRLVDEGTAKTLYIDADYDQWRVSVGYRVRFDSALVERDWELTFTGPGETKLRYFSTVTRLDVGDPQNWTLLLPGWDGQVAEQPLTSLNGQKPLTVVDAPFIRIGLVGLRRGDANVMLWPCSGVDAF